jgi:hypothetical protein
MYHLLAFLLNYVSVFSYTLFMMISFCPFSGNSQFSISLGLVAEDLFWCFGSVIFPYFFPFEEAVTFPIFTISLDRDLGVISIVFLLMFILYSSLF